MAVRLEHANLNVRDPEGMIRFLQTAFPEFRLRGEGICHGTRWVHVGTDDTYIVLNPAKADSERHWVPFDKNEGVVKRHLFSAMLCSTAWISERWRTEA